MALTLKAMFRKGLKQPARCGKRHPAAVAVKQARSHLLFEGPYLRGYGWLRHPKLLCCARETAEAANLLKCSQLLEIHRECPESPRFSAIWGIAQCSPKSLGRVS
jgi:hypothetical protein